MINPGNTASYVESSHGCCSGPWRCRSSGPLSMSGGAASGSWRASLAEAAAPAQETRSDRIRLLRCYDDPAFADPVQPAVCRSDRPRRGLSLGQRDIARRYQLCVLRASRRLSPHPHGVAGGRLRSRRNEARRPGRAISVIRPLVYLWVAQNVLLVASSILRLDLYVQIYLLTWWRIAAFIWMLLVAFGLLLIVARIALNRSNGWLIRANLITLTATLYVCSLVNFAAMIADYNVSHSREAARQGRWNRYKLSASPWPSGLAGHRQGHCASWLRSRPCFPSWLPCRTATERHEFLAQLGFPELAASAHPGRPTDEFDHRLIRPPRRDV